MTDSRIPPYSEEAERCLLGAILLDHARVLDLCVEAGLTEEAFYVPVHRTIYAAMLAMLRAGAPVDSATLAEALRAAGNLEAIGGGRYLDNLVDQTPTAAHAEYYLSIVSDKHLLRSVIAVCRDVEQQAYDSDDDPENQRSKAEFALGQLQRVQATTDEPKAIISRQFGIWEMAKKTGCAGIPTGFRVIDQCFGGLLEASFMVVSGKRGSCKTTLARNVCENIGMRGVPCSYCSLEQTAEQIWGAIVARQARQSVFLLNCGSNKVHWPAMTEAAGIVHTWPIYVDDRPKTPAQLWSWARREVNKHGSKLLVLDYLQAMTPDQKYRSDESKITDFSGTCRAIAKDLRVCVLAIATLSNEGNLRGSGQIGYDAWGHINLRQADDYAIPGNMHYQADIEKQRFGPTFRGCDLWLIGDEQRLEERDPALMGEPREGDYYAEEP